MTHHRDCSRCGESSQGGEQFSGYDEKGTHYNFIVCRKCLDLQLREAVETLDKIS